MDREGMVRLVEARLEAEASGDSGGCVAAYSEDVELDIVGSSHGPLYGRAEARRFYERFIGDAHADELIPVRAFYGEDFCVLEHEWRGTVGRSFLGIAGRVDRVSLRVLHVWEFRDDLISRENVWIDVSALTRQLRTEPSAAGVAS